MRLATKTVFSYLDRESKPVVLAEGLLAVAALCVADYLTGWETSLSAFYLLVIGAVSYHAGMPAGAAVAAASVASWNATDVLTGIPYTRWYALYWNVAVRLVMFLGFAYAMAFLRKEVKLVEDMARADPLTGAANRRHFQEQVALEMQRAARRGRPFTVAYIDLDGFKAVNDRLGHRAGDEVLRAVAGAIRAGSRATDCAARLGGDEFAVLLPETGAGPAGICLGRVRQRLLEAMRAGGWEVGFSVGAVTYLAPPGSADEVIARADALMYDVKRAGKGAVRYELFPSGDAPMACAEP